jgi:hypothetical protein
MTRARRPEALCFDYGIALPQSQLKGDMRQAPRLRGCLVIHETVDRPLLQAQNRGMRSILMSNRNQATKIQLVTWALFGDLKAPKALIYKSIGRGGGDRKQ